MYCSRACQQAAYRARQRTSTGQRQHRGRQRATGEEWRHQQRRQRAGSDWPGADGRHHQRQEEHAGRHQQRQPPPTSANGYRPGATTSERERYRRIVEALLRKAASTPHPQEAAACRAKAEALRAKYGL